MEKNKTRGGFSDSLGFVLSAAGSAVGLGNLWRFPFLAAKGGGLFILVYIILSVTFGFTLLLTEIAIGRKTGVSPILAFEKLNSRFKIAGILSFIIPFAVMPYYSVIGGWVVKYTADFLLGYGSNIVQNENYFSLFLQDTFFPILFMVIYLSVTAIIVACGVEKGLEKSSKILMPTLIIIMVGITSYTICLRDENSGRTALSGLLIYLKPNFSTLTFKTFIRTLFDAIGQLFFSLSISIGVMITLGSYTKRDSDLCKSVDTIERFDTGIALLAGALMVPAVYCFLGAQGLENAGPSLMFKTLPKVFYCMGVPGKFIGLLFFVLVLFAAITSSVSIMEAVVCMIIDKFSLKRKTACIIVFAVSLIFGIIICLGYNSFNINITLPDGTRGSLLELFDWFINNILMPITGIITCIIVGWIIKPKTVIDEVMLSTEKFKREKMYTVMIKYIAPILLVIIIVCGVM